MSTTTDCKHESYDEHNICDACRRAVAFCPMCKSKRLSSYGPYKKRCYDCGVKGILPSMCGLKMPNDSFNNNGEKMKTTTEKIIEATELPCPDYPSVGSKGSGIYRELACNHADKMAELLERANFLICKYYPDELQWKADFERFQKGEG